MSSFQPHWGRLVLLTLFVSGGALTAVGSFCHAAPRTTAPHKKPPVKGHIKPGSLPPLTAVGTVPTAPPPQAEDVMLYDGQAPAQSGLNLSAWGGGAVEDNGEVSFSKGHSLKVTTLGPYQGAKILFPTPVNLGDMTDPQRVLVFMLRLTADTRHLSSRRFPAPSFSVPNQAPRLIFAQYPQGPPPGGFVPPGVFVPPGGFVPPGAFPGDQGNSGFGPAPQAAPLPPQILSSIHLIFTRADGLQTDVIRPFPDLSQTDAGAGAEQWVAVGVPLAALHFAGGTANSPLQSVIVAGNDYAVFYLGQMRLTRDTAPLSCFAGASMTVPVGEAVVLHGTADGGLSSLKYSWDFDAADGITDEAQGSTVITTYLKPNDYTATLTVSDIDGLKKPATSTVAVHVQ